MPYFKRVHRRADIVHAQNRGAGLCRQQRGGNTGRLALLDRATGERTQHGFARHPDQHRRQRGKARQGAEQGDVVGERLAETETGVDAETGAGDAVRLGGVGSGEHGVGFVKMPIFLGTKSDEELAILRGIKASFDPDNIMNPGKVLGDF